MASAAGLRALAELEAEARTMREEMRSEKRAKAAQRHENKRDDLMAQLRRKEARCDILTVSTIWP